MKTENENPFEIGTAYFVRTLTYHIVGKLVKKTGTFLVFKDAAWVADSGRFTQAIDTGTLSEVEPVSVTVFVNTQNICDAFEWKHKLPREQK